MKNPAAVALGSIRSERKAQSAVENGRMGGRPVLSSADSLQRRAKPFGVNCLAIGAKPLDYYATVNVAGKSKLAHRVAYELAYGPIPDKLLVLHKCDVMGCVNPEHLFLGTHKDNSQDALKKGRHGGHFARRKKNGGSGYAGVDIEDVIKILRANS